MMRRLKKIIRGIFQYAGYIAFPKIRIHTESKYYILGSQGNFFVGYYDIDPVSSSGKQILCHRVNVSYSHQSEPEVGDIGLIDIISNGGFKKITETRALNWQLGSRLRWLSEDVIIYNDVKDGLQCSIAFNLKTNKIERQYSRPFWALSPDCNMGASLNFSRIRKKRPGYGYRGESPDGDKELLTLFSIGSDEVLFQIDLVTLMEKIGFDCPDNVDPYLNHVTWSPCSSKLLTLFHYDDPVKLKRFIFPVLVNCIDFSVSAFHSEGNFSHHVWMDNDSLLGFVELDNDLCFAKWNQSSGWVKIVGSMPILDGHPSLVPNSTSKVIVDSYPDRLGRMSLYIGSTEREDKLVKIATIMNYMEYTGSIRCDLHPKTSKNNNSVICDMPIKGGRKILVMENVF